MAEAGLGHTLYGAAPRPPRLSLDDVEGVEPGRPVGVLPHAGLAAVTGRVSLAEFGSEPLRHNLNDLDWLARVARAHQAVLDRALASGPIVPLRLCTVFADEAHVREMLESEHDVLADALARVRGRAEWGVKLIADVSRLQEAIGASAKPGEESSGRAYLEGRSRERRAREEAQRIVQQAAEEVHARLRQQAAAATLLRPQSRELSGRAGEMVLNGAYLVERSRVDQFQATAAELGERQRPLGLALELTGPWPPYNFVAPIVP
jgi:hypothetical protein